jgi:glyoxylase-like metal-dependent hydrolase (beta-lactamase superfamily II)
MTRPVLSRVALSLLAVAAALAAGCAQQAAKSSSGIQRMYVFNCGESRTTDVSRWSPGVNVGQPWEFSNNCYLIRHAQGLMLWDTGLADSIAAMPDGLVALGGALQMRMPKTLVAQLAEIGVKPTDVRLIAFSHFHPDHAGNANLFPNALLFIQETEYEALFGPAPQKFGFQPAQVEKLRGNPTVRLKGDRDVFGDGSVVILSTPGHTPGHQSLLVRLPQTGAVILSGDMAHFESNWTNRRVPGMNFNSAESVKSMDRVAALMKQYDAQLWINHDKTQSARVPKAPQHLE